MWILIMRVLITVGHLHEEVTVRFGFKAWVFGKGTRAKEAE